MKKKPVEDSKSRVCMSDFEGLWVTLEFGTVLSIHENCHINIPKKEEQQVQSWEQSKKDELYYRVGYT